MVGKKGYSGNIDAPKKPYFTDLYAAILQKPTEISGIISTFDSEYEQKSHEERANIRRQYRRKVSSLSKYGLVDRRPRDPTVISLIAVFKEVNKGNLTIGKKLIKNLERLNKRHFLLTPGNPEEISKYIFDKDFLLFIEKVKKYLPVRGRLKKKIDLSRLSDPKFYVYTVSLRGIIKYVFERILNQDNHPLTKDIDWSYPLGELIVTYIGNFIRPPGKNTHSLHFILENLAITFGEYTFENFQKNNRNVKLGKGEAIDHFMSCCLLHTLKNQGFLYRQTGKQLTTNLLGDLKA